MRRWSAILLVVALGCAGEGGAPNAPGHRGRNIVLVTLDTVRADHLGSYGYRDAETPVLDRLARDGVRFAAASSAVPLTLPAHATLLSGLLPPQHGVRQNGAGAFPADRPTLATLLAQDGYRTGAFIGAFVLDRRFGLARGFEVYDDEVEREPSAAPGGLEAERPGAQVMDRALAWLGRDEARPFFLWVHLYDAHAPYSAPAEFRARHPQRPYDAEIAYVDSQVGRLIAELARRGEDENTIVAVTADHGEALGEHGELTHGLLLYEATLHVPLLLRSPQLRAGSVVRTPVGLADLAPTLAGLAGVEAGALTRESSGAGGGSNLQSAAGAGRDLSAALMSASEPAAGEQYSETEYPRIFGWSGIAALRRGSLKYIRAPRDEMYELERDPHETASLLGETRRRPDLRARISELRARPRASGGAAPDAEARAKLASLGYVDGVLSPDPEAEISAGATNPRDMAAAFVAFETATRDLYEGRYAQATDRLAQLVAADPHNPVFRGSLAQAYRGAGDLRRAITLYREAVASDPADPQGRYNLAVTLQEAGRYEEAFAAIREAIARDPARPEAHNALGITLWARGDAPAALAEFERAVELDGRNAQAHNNRGNVLRALGRRQESRAAYARALEVAPRYAEAWNGLGALEVELDDAGRALECFARALALAPAYHEARLNRGIALEMKGDSAAALAAYREFLDAAALDPTFAGQRRVAAQLIARLEGRAPGGVASAK